MDVILCERTGRWAARLRPFVAGQAGVRLRELRFLAGLWAALDGDSPCLVALELTPSNAAAVAATLIRLRHHAPRAVPVLLGTNALEPLQWWFRELGAAHFLVSPMRLLALAQVVVRDAGESAPALDVRDEIRRLVPWPGD